MADKGTLNNVGARLRHCANLLEDDHYKSSLFIKSIAGKIANAIHEPSALHHGEALGSLLALQALRSQGMSFEDEPVGAIIDRSVADGIGALKSLECSDIATAGAFFYDLGSNAPYEIMEGHYKQYERLKSLGNSLLCIALLPDDDYTQETHIGQAFRLVMESVTRRALQDNAYPQGIETTADQMMLIAAQEIKARYSNISLREVAAMIRGVGEALADTDHTVGRLAKDAGNSLEYLVYGMDVEERLPMAERKLTELSTLREAGKLAGCPMLENVLALVPDALDAWKAEQAEQTLQRERAAQNTSRNKRPRQA